MKILVVDDHEVVRRGVVSLLSSRPEYEVCGEAVDGRDAVEKAQQLKPDVIVMDVSMPKLNGLEATRMVRRVLPDSEVLILSQHESEEMVRQAFNAGARGYVVKSSIAKDLLNAVAKIAKHEPFLDRPTSGGDKPSRHVDAQEILQRSAALEHALRESEELYRSTFDLAAVGVAHVSPDGRWLRVNRKVCEITGYTKDELLNLTFQDVTYPEDLQSDLDQAQRMIAGEVDQYSIEKRYVRKNGSLVWINLTVSAVRDESRKLKYFISIIEDIDSRKEADLARFRLAAIVEGSDDAVVSKDLNGIVKSWNAGAERIFGYTAEEAVGKSILLIIPPELHSEETEILRRLRNGERIGHFETTRVAKDGRRLFVSLTISPVRNSQGKVVGVSKIAQDITERKRAEAALRESERRFSIMADAAPILIWMTGTDGKASFFNRHWLEFTGRPLTKEVGNGWTENIHPDDRERFLTLYQHCFSKREACNLEYRLKRADGQYRWLLSQGVPRYTAANEFAGFIGSCVDITERRQAEQRIQTSEDRLRTALDVAAAGVWDNNLAENKFHWSPTVFTLLGYSIDECVPSFEAWKQRVHPEDLDRVLHLYAEAKAGRATYDNQYRVVWPDGTLHWLDSKGRFFFDENGKAVRFLGAFTDISQHKSSEAALRESEQRFSAFFHSAAVGAARADFQTGRFLEVNEKFCCMLGYTTEELRALTFRDVSYPGDFSPTPGQEQSYETDKRYVRKDGKVIWAHVAVNSVFSEQDTPLYYVAIITDITDRKLAEEATRENEERTRFSLEAASVGTWEWDLSSGEVHWSENMESIHGQRPGSFGGSFESFLAGVHPDDREKIPELVQQAIAGNGKYHVEYRQLRADGSVGWMEGNGQVIYDAQRKPMRMMGVCFEITQRKQAEENLQAAHAELEQRVRERTAELVLKNDELVRQSVLIRDLSRRLLEIQDEERRRIAREMHDSVGQLLAAMSMNFSHALNECQKLSPLASKALFDNAELLEQTTREVRTLSHLLHPPLLDEAGLGIAIQMYVEGFSERSKVGVTLDIPEDLGRLPKEIELTLFRIVQESLTNIHRHSESSTASIRIAEDDHQLCLEIRDKGQGIPESKLQLLNTSAGTGVGIRGMRERLRQLGGDLEIQSSANGTILRAVLPVVRAAVATDQPA